MLSELADGTHLPGCIGFRPFTLSDLLDHDCAVWHGIAAAP